MEGIGLLITICFLITFGPPVVFFIIGLFKHNRNRDTAKILYIVGAVWLIVGGGMCVSIMMDA